MRWALAMPPTGSGGRRARREVVAAWQLTPAGAQALPERVTRAPAARALLARFALGERTLPAADASALSPRQKRTLRAWREQGFVVGAPAADADAAGTSHTLNDAQRGAVDEIAKADGAFAPFLLNGVTGSGKTDVYLAAAAPVFASGRQVLMLVPEINLTPQLVARVRHALPGLSIATLHSGLPAGERSAAWHAAAAGDARLVLGTRLAVFAPMPALGLVVVDEEQDASYKQQDGVRYHARDAAVWRAHRRGVPVVLGSATPSLESWLHAREGRYRRLDLPARADPRASPPRVRLTANRAARAQDGIGDQMREAIGDPARARRAVAGVREPPRLRAVARVRVVPVGGAVPALQRAAHHAPRSAARCAAITADTRSACPRRARSAATSTCSRWDSARSGSSARWRRRSRPRASRGWIATPRRRATRSRRCATRSARARSTSSSARRCWRRATISRG